MSDSSMPPLNFNLTDVDTSRAVPESGKHLCKIAEAAFKESSKTPGNWNLMVKFVTTEPILSSKGEELQPGFPIFAYLPCQQSENPAAPDYQVGLAKLLDGVFGERPNLNQETLNEMVNRDVVVVGKFKAAKEDSEYGDSFNINDYEAVQ